MNYSSIRCWDGAGRLTFDIDIRTIRVMSQQLIPSGSTGSIPLSQLPSGLEGVGLIPASPTRHWTDNIAPFCWVEGGNFNWRGSVGMYYLVVYDIVGFGGNTHVDIATPEGD